jgi:hypothetical protein
MDEVPQVYFIGEAALRGSVLQVDSRPDHRAVHHDQLAHLLEQQATRPAVDIRVLPSFAERILQASYHRDTQLFGALVPEFVVLQGARGRIGVYSDGLAEGSVVEPAGIVQGLPKDRILEQLAGMATIALSLEESTAYIEQIMDTVVPLPLSPDAT